MQVNVPVVLPATFKVESRESFVMVDVTKLSVEMVSKFVLHGIKQKVADAAAGAAGDACASKFGAGWKEVAKADRIAYLESDAGKAKVAEFTVTAMQTVLDAVYAGDWESRGEGGGAAPVDPVIKLAHDNAKAELVAKFKAATGKKKLVDMANANEAVAKYFVIKDLVAAWKETEVAAYIVKAKESGKRDFIADAKVALESVAGESIDF